MHISSDRLTKRLTAIEQAHVATCPECQDEQGKMLLLTSSGQNMDLIRPGESVWLELQAKKAHIDSKKANGNSNRQSSKKDNIFISNWYGRVAAAIVIGLMINLSYQQYGIQKELVALKESNYLLELQLSDSPENFSSQELVKQILKIDQNLNGTESKEEAIRKLRQREKLMKVIIKLKMNGKENELISL